MNDLPTSAWTIESNDETFEVDAIDRSRTDLVVVDFWSDTCQPCRLLAPVLQEVVDEFEGKVVLVMVNVEQAPQTAANFQVQAVPAVFAMIDGQVADTFQGLVPEETIREWFTTLLRHKHLVMLKALEQTDATSAERQYREILEDDPDSPHANIGLARLLASKGDSETAGQIIGQLEERGFLEPEAEQVKASLLLQEEVTDLAEARTAAADAPGDFPLQLALAEALAAEGEHAESMDIALSLIEQDRQQTGTQAHQLMLNIFKVLPDDAELVSTYRRRLAMTLY